jgi:nucleotide sugar dehydrogenase
LQTADRIDVLSDFAPHFVFIGVDTPIGDNGDYDHSNVDRVLRELLVLRRARAVTDLVILCTTTPGFCDSRADAMSAHGYALSYSPAFVAQGSILIDQRRPDQVLIGQADSQAGERIETVYRRMCENRPAVHRMSRLSAEIAKLATNCALTMKIAFANAVGDLALRAGADPTTILDAVGADNRIGPGFLRYGFGYGGPCLPRDNRALNVFATRHGCEIFPAEAVDEMNRRHLAFQISHYLERHPLNEPIHFEWVTYKPGTDILEESQPLAVAVALARAGRTVVIHEQPSVVTELRNRFGDLFQYRARTDAQPGHSTHLDVARKTHQQVQVTVPVSGAVDE